MLGVYVAMVCMLLPPFGLSGTCGGWGCSPSLTYYPSVGMPCSLSADETVKCCDHTVAMSRTTKAPNRSVFSRSETIDDGRGSPGVSAGGSRTDSDSLRSVSITINVFKNEEQCTHLMIGCTRHVPPPCRYGWVYSMSHLSQMTTLSEPGSIEVAQCTSALGSRVSGSANRDITLHGNLCTDSCPFGSITSNSASTQSYHAPLLR